MKIKLLLYLVLICLVVTCKSTEKIETSNKLFEIIYQDNFKGSSLKSYRLIKNNDDYKAIFLQLKITKIPYVDFDKENVLILNMGKRKTTGYSVYPEKMIEDNGKIIVILKEIIPSPDKITNKISSPITIVKINSKKKLIIM